MSDLLNYYKRQNEEQRQIIEDLEKTIKRKDKEIYEVKQSIYKKIIEVRDVGESNDIYKNIKMLKILNELTDDLYFDVQEYLTEEVKEDYKKELVDLQNQN